MTRGGRLSYGLQPTLVKHAVRISHMVMKAPEGEFSDSWTYEPMAPARRPVLWRAAEVCALVTGLVALGIAVAVPLVWAYRAAGELLAGRPPDGEISIMRMEPVHVGSGHDRSDADEAGETLTRERAARSAAEREARAVLQRLAVAERAAQDARQELLAEQNARRNADQTLGEMREELIRERTAKEAAELATKEALARKPTHWRLKKVERWAW
jgi:hypothetical protein